MSINFLVSSTVILVFYESLEFHLNNMALKQQTPYYTYKKKVNIGKRHGHQSGGIMAQMMYYSKWAFIFFVTKVRRNWVIVYKIVVASDSAYFNLLSEEFELFSCL